MEVIRKYKLVITFKLEEEEAYFSITGHDDINNVNFTLDNLLNYINKLYFILNNNIESITIVLTNDNICNLNLYKLLCMLVDMIFDTRTLTITLDTEIIINEGILTQNSIKKCPGINVVCKKGSILNLDNRKDILAHEIYSSWQFIQKTLPDNNFQTETQRNINEFNYYINFIVSNKYKIESIFNALYDISIKILKTSDLPEYIKDYFTGITSKLSDYKDMTQSVTEYDSQASDLELWDSSHLPSPILKPNTKISQSRPESTTISQQYPVVDMEFHSDKKSRKSDNLDTAPIKPWDAISYNG